MTGERVVASLESLLTGFTVHRGSVPSSPSYPYVLVVTGFPGVSERAVSRVVHSRVVRSRTIVVGLTASQVRIISQKVTDCLEGKRPVVEGWRLGRIESEPNDQPIQEDMDITIPGAGVHPLYQPFDWVMTASQSN